MQPSLEEPKLYIFCLSQSIQRQTLNQRITINNQPCIHDTNGAEQYILEQRLIELYLQCKRNYIFCYCILSFFFFKRQDSWKEFWLFIKLKTGHGIIIVFAKAWDIWIRIQKKMKRMYFENGISFHCEKKRKSQFFPNLYRKL